jgi:hypothetical protein
MTAPRDVRELGAGTAKAGVDGGGCRLSPIGKNFRQFPPSPRSALYAATSPAIVRHSTHHVDVNIN